MEEKKKLTLEEEFDQVLSELQEALLFLEESDIFDDESVEIISEEEDNLFEGLLLEETITEENIDEFIDNLSEEVCEVLDEDWNSWLARRANHRYIRAEKAKLADQKKVAIKNAKAANNAQRKVDRAALKKAYKKGKAEFKAKIKEVERSGGDATELRNKRDAYKKSHGAFGDQSARKLAKIQQQKNNENSVKEITKKHNDAVNKLEANRLVKDKSTGKNITAEKAGVAKKVGEADSVSSEVVKKMNTNLKSVKPAAPKVEQKPTVVNKQSPLKDVSKDAGSKKAIPAGGILKEEDKVTHSSDGSTTTTKSDGSKTIKHSDGSFTFIRMPAIGGPQKLETNLGDVIKKNKKGLREDEETLPTEETVETTSPSVNIEVLPDKTVEVNIAETKEVVVEDTVKEDVPVDGAEPQVEKAKEAEKHDLDLSDEILKASEDFDEDVEFVELDEGVLSALKDIAIKAGSGIAMGATKVFNGIKYVAKMIGGSPVWHPIAAAAAGAAAVGAGVLVAKKIKKSKEEKEEKKAKETVKEEVSSENLEEAHRDDPEVVELTHEIRDDAERLDSLGINTSDMVNKAELDDLCRKDPLPEEAPEVLEESKKAEESQEEVEEVVEEQPAAEEQVEEAPVEEVSEEPVARVEISLTTDGSMSVSTAEGKEVVADQAGNIQISLAECKNTEYLLKSYLTEDCGMSTKEFVLLSEDAKVESLKDIVVSLLKSLQEKLEGVDTSSADRSRGDVKQLAELPILQDAITKLESLIERDENALPEYSKFVGVIIKSILYLNQYSSTFRDAYRNKKTLMIMKYESIILSIISALSYILSTVVSYRGGEVSLRDKAPEGFLEFGPYKTLSTFVKSVESGEFKTVISDTNTLREFYLEVPVEKMSAVLEAVDFNPTIVDSIKSLVSSFVDTNKLSGLLYKVAGVIVLLFSLREVFYTLFRMKNKISDMLSHIENFAKMGFGGNILGKLQSFANKFKVDAESASDMSKHEIEDENRKTLNQVKKIQVSSIANKVAVEEPKEEVDNSTKEVVDDVFSGFDF